MACKTGVDRIGRQKGTLFSLLLSNETKEGGIGPFLSKKGWFMNLLPNVAIIGAGTMGHSLAQVFAQGGLAVRLVDRNDEILKKAKRLIESNLETLSSEGVGPEEPFDEVVGRIVFTENMESACRDAQFVIEATYEDRDVKKAVFDKLDVWCPQDTILASNTSYMDVFELVTVHNPGRLLITHWFAPPHIVPLVEIVRGPLTSDETVETVRSLLRSVGKTPVVISRFLPGFIVNRLQSALRNEVLYLLDNGYATPEEIDLAAKASFALRTPIVGLVKKMDFTGLDLTQKAVANADYRTPPQQTNYVSLDRLVAAGRLGVKTGAGFYDYGGQTPEEIMRERDAKLLKLIRFLKDIGEL